MWGMGIVLLLLAVAAIMAYRANRFVAPAQPELPAAAIAVNGTQAAGRLGEALQFPTLSRRDPEQVEAGAFRDFQTFLERSFPLAHAAMKKDLVNDFSLLYTWPGKDPERLPILLMAHQDVVPVAPGTEQDWTHPPFAGEVAEGYVWGRGALDVKSGLMGIFEAVETLLQEGFRPPRTIYLASGHDEEVGGSQGSARIAALLKARGVRLALVLDEGGAVLEDGLPGVAAPVATVGIAERGFVNLELTARGRSGHASMPGKDSSIALLTRALARLEARPFPAELDCLRTTYRHLASHLDFAYRLVFANLWLLGPLAGRWMSATPRLNASIRTTLAPTMIRGGVQPNVMPGQASVVLNARIVPGMDVEGVIERVRRVIAEPRVEIRQLEGCSNPSPVSDPGSRGFAVLAETIRQTAGLDRLSVAPYLVVGGTDSRYFAPLADNVYRFLLNRLKAEDFSRIHGTDERIGVDNYVRVIAFYTQLLRRADDF